MKLRTTIPVLAVFMTLSTAWADRQELVGSFVQPLVDGKVIAGCVVGIVEDGKAEVFGFGTTDLDNPSVPDGQTLFEIGSVTKAFTGTLLADMVNRKEIDLESPLSSFLPEHVKLKEVEGHPIRLIDLAAQRSGLPRMPTNFAPADPANPYADYTAERLYEFLNGYALTRPPGEYEYSNLGMGLLGHILAGRAGKSYEALLIERLCKPLAMNDTVITLRDGQQLARPYDAGLKPSHPWDLNVLAGAGGIRSNANDMLKFAQAALAEDDREVVKAIHKAFEPVGGATTAPSGPMMGLAWMIAGDGQTRWHNGQTGGYSAVLFIHPGGKKAVVVLSNTATDKTAVAGEKIIQALFGLRAPPLELPREVRIAPEILQRYVGDYELAPGAILSITLQEGQLMAQLTGQAQYPIFPSSETEFYYRVVDAQLSFVVNEKGEVDRLVLHQNGRDIPGPRAK